MAAILSRPQWNAFDISSLSKYMCMCFMLFVGAMVTAEINVPYYKNSGLNERPCELLLNKNVFLHL